AALNALLADTFALYLKTKNFHWHVSGPHFRDYHRLLDEQAGQLEALTSWPSGCAGSAAPPSARLAISPSCSGSRTTTRITCRRSPCGMSLRTTTRLNPATCAPPTSSPTSTKT